MIFLLSNENVFLYNCAWCATKYSVAFICCAAGETENVPAVGRIKVYLI